MRKTFFRGSALLMTMLLVTVIFTVPSFAYFNRGPVSLSVGQTSLNLKTGGSASVSVNIQPIKEQQLPGCGMAECPQSCGATGCLNEYGECTCGGTTYQTYYSSVSVTSSNSGVASASYSGGTLTVKGVSAGTATLTLIGSMRQYTDTSVQVAVTVTDPAGDGAKVEKASSPVTEDQPGVAVSEMTPEEPENSAGKTTDTAVEDGSPADSEVIETRRGVFEIVELTPETDVKAHLQAAAENHRHVTFQKKDGENVLYSLTFDGTTMDSSNTEGSASDLNGSISTEPGREWQELSGNRDGVLMEFNSSGKLAAQAEIYVRVSPVFADGQVVRVLGAGPDGSSEELASDLKVENGYVTFTAEELEPMLITEPGGSEETEAGAGERSLSGYGIPLAAGCAAVAAAAVFTVLRLRKKQ
ncbi:MAG: hypothetical protein K5767_00285 [Clostridia bacterium]|nr:hypothetical protein [Clostridia bacterium]